MSPASSGGLEVERYIGACLISSHGRKNHSGNHQYPGYISCRNGWAGMPLISFAPRKVKLEDSTTNTTREDVQLSRLAVHTQGLPLILSRNQGNRRSKSRNINVQPPADSLTPADSLSVASDESSNASETSLPRIIKPRKRRKKDRKPPREAPESSIRVPYCFPIEDKLDESPQLHHRFEDLPEDADLRAEPSVCQCRYCDPSGQIWDVDRHCYSPFLTHPPKLFHSISDPSGDDRISSALRKQCLISLDDLNVKEKLPNRTQIQSRSQSQFEISTKIVTSMNGHRDLEIRLFSTNSFDRQCVVNSEASLTPEE